MKGRAMMGLKWLWLSLVIVAFMAGCARLHSRHGKPPAEPVKEWSRSPSHTITWRFYAHPPKRVAILPLSVVSEDEKGRSLKEEKEIEHIAKEALYKHISVKNYEDVELHKVISTLEELNIKTYEDLMKAPKTLLGEKLGVDALVFGEVTVNARLYALIYSQMALGAHVWMVDASSGELLWDCNWVRRRHKGGVSINPLGAISDAITAALQYRKGALDSASDDLFRGIAETLPDLETPFSTTVTVKAEKALIHAEPESSGPLLAQVNRDEQLPFLRKTNDLYEVRLKDNQKGWIDASLVEGPQPLHALKDNEESSVALEEVRAKIDDGLWEESAQELEGIVKRYEEDAQAHFLLGSVYLKLAKKEKAIQEMEKAVALEPENPGYKYNLGIAYYQVGEKQKAIEVWKKLLETDPSHSDADFLVKWAEASQKGQALLIKGQERRSHEKTQ